MDARGLEKFRCLLTDMKSNLMNHSAGDIGNECARGNDGDVTQNHLIARMKTQLTARNAENIKRIDVALKRIKSGSFGHCSECEEEIEERRLESNPITTLCASCKEDEEKRQSSFIGSRRRSA